MEIKKIQFKHNQDELRIVLHTEDAGVEGKPKLKQDCGARAHPDFLNAIEAAKLPLARILNVDTELCARNAKLTKERLADCGFDVEDRITITAVTFADSKLGAEYVTFSGWWAPHRHFGAVEFKTPEVGLFMRSRPQTDEGWGIDDRLCHLDDLIDVTDALRREARLYFEGKRAQGSLFAAPPSEIHITSEHFKAIKEATGM